MTGEAAEKPYPRWVGVLLSLLIPGTGLFLAGKRVAGVCWFFLIMGVWLMDFILTPLPTLSGLLAFHVMTALSIALTVCVLILSYNPVQRLGIRGWILFLLLVLAFSESQRLIVHRFAWPFRIPTGGMEPTIKPGDKIFAQCTAYWFNSPRRGDVVVFRGEPSDTAGMLRGEIYIKRVAALPGETLQIKDGHMTINDRELDWPPVPSNPHPDVSRLPFPGSPGGTYRIPPDKYFVIGDNLTNSLDSRYFGPIPRQSILGKATKIYSPSDRAGDIR